MSLTIQLLPKGKPIKGLPLDISLSKEASTSELYQQIAHKSRFPVHQIRITKGSDGTLIPCERSIPLGQTGLLEGSKVYVKDLGRQIGWRTCYVIEYFGPIFIHPLFYFLRPYIYSKPPQDPKWPISPADSEFPAPSLLQTFAVVIIVLHFCKRELETTLVHHFSNATMPFINVVKNSAYYWFLAGVFPAYFTYSPSSPAASDKHLLVGYLGLALFVVGEIINFYTHIVLMNLRADGSTERKIPVGFSFDWVTCPNYFWEILAWIGIILVNRDFATVVFISVGTTQMIIWARKKERNYRKQFGDKYKKKRSAVFPGLI